MKTSFFLLRLVVACLGFFLSGCATTRWRPDARFVAPVLADFDASRRGEISAWAFGPQDTLYLAGSFTSVNGTAAPGLVRLTNRGTVDTVFLAKLPPGIENLRGILVEPDVKLVIVNQYSILLRLLADGSLDPTFHPFANSTNLWNVRRQPDGKFLYLHTTTAESYIGRRRSDGSEDPSWHRIEKLTPPEADPYKDSRINAFELDRYGRVIAVGAFSHVDGTARQNIVRLTTEGRVDPTFDSPDITSVEDFKILSNYRGGSFNDVLPLPDGRLLVRLALGYQSKNGFRQVIRLQENGGYDASFEGIDARNRAQGGVLLSLTRDSRGGLLMTGLFNQINGQPVAHSLARTLKNGRFDETFLYEGFTQDDRLNTVKIDASGQLWIEKVSAEPRKRFYSTVIRMTR